MSFAIESAAILPFASAVFRASWRLDRGFLILCGSYEIGLLADEMYGTDFIFQGRPVRGKCHLRLADSVRSDLLLSCLNHPLEHQPGFAGGFGIQGNSAAHFIHFRRLCKCAGFRRLQRILGFLKRLYCGLGKISG